MSLITGITRDGRSWTPEFLIAIDAGECIGCARCFKVCNHDVLHPVGIGEDGDETDFDDEDAIRKVMTVGKGGNCIGCGSCAKVCGTKAQKHQPLARAA